MRRGRRPPDVHVVLVNDVRAPHLARVAVQSVLDNHRDPIVWKVTLAVSELVTNVIIHTAQGGEMHVWDSSAANPLRLEVHDRNHALPTRPMRPSLGGRGLGIVDSVADDWGVTPTPTGKLVWAEFDAPVG